MEVEGTGVQESMWDVIFDGYGDINEWFIMGSPITAIVITSAYLLFVLKIGPAYMKDKPPYKLRNVLLIHNAAQVLYSGYLVLTGYRIIYEAGFIEKTCFMNNKKRAYMLRSGIHLYVIAKLAELLDTVFFVLRKKWNQISFLHVYHHSLMFFASWCCLKYAPSYNFVFLGTLNSFVHVVMYTYYGLAAFPGLRKYLWWKKYITKLQLIQFTIVFVNVTVNFYTSVCPPSYFMISIAWSNLILFFYLFSKFYINSYNTKNKAKQVDMKKSNMTSNVEKHASENGHQLIEKIR